MKKTIGIITTFKANNYGAELQAYATQQKLRSLGYEAELIDYLFYKNRRYKYTKGAKPWTHFTLRQRLKHYALYRLLLPITDIVGVLVCRQIRERKHRFEAFHEQHSHLSRTYYSQEELYHAKMNYDVYCVGSDQVWNPATAVSMEPYFLAFAPSDAKKISYASSFGVASVPSETIEKYKRGLANLDRISCREAQGVNLVRLLTGREAAHVLDPTLLLDGNEWRNVSEYTFCPQKGKYILLYNIAELSVIYTLARRISKETGWPIVKLCKRAIFLKRHERVQNVPTAGPADFVGMIDNAGIFLTNSFHGIAFALNLETPFWVVLDENMKNNSRMVSLLSLLGLQNRILALDEGIDKVDYQTPIDFHRVNGLLEKERQKSLCYLRSAIED